MWGKQSKMPAAPACRAGSHVKVRETQAEAAPAARACQAGAGAAASMEGARKCVCRHARVEWGGEGPAAAALARDLDRCHAVVVAQHPCTCRSGTAELRWKTAIQCMRREAGCAAAGAVAAAAAALRVMQVWGLLQRTRTAADLLA